MKPWWLRNVKRDAAGEGGEGGGGDAAAAAKAKAEAEAAAAAKAKADAEAEAARIKAEAEKKGGPTDAEAKLLKEVMERKKAQKDLEDRLKAFEGLDPAQVKALVEAQKKADDEKKAAEQKRLEEQGQYDKLKAQMLESHDKQVKELNEKLSAEVTAKNSLSAQIADLTVGSAFSASQFVTTEMALTPSKARVIYGSHFSFENGKVVAYDKPTGASERTMLIDGRGNPLSFDEAIQKIVDADPEKDHLLKSKMKPGAGSSSQPGNTRAKEGAADLRGSARIAAALKSSPLSASK